MGSLNIDFLKRADNGSSDHLYADVHLDLENDYKVRANFAKSSTKLVDIRVSRDMEAIYNSLTSIFGTSPGERLLLPEFGCDLRNFLFAPVSDVAGSAIGHVIKQAVEKWEPRVVIDLISIVPRPEEHEYVISLELVVPTLKTRANYTGNFIQGEGFVRG